MDAQRLIPHRPPLCFVNRLLIFQGRSGVSDSLVLPDNPLLNEDKSLHPLALVELIAQSYAAVKGYQDLLEAKQVKRGFLVGIGKIRFKDPVFEGQILKTWVEETDKMEEFAVVKGEVTRGEEVVAFGNIKVWMPQEDP